MPYLGKLCSSYLQIAHCAVDENSVVGEDMRFSVEYEALEMELAKGQSLHPGVATDWQKVLEGSETLLRTRSKDLRVAAWLTWALYQCESFTGLLAGLGMLQELCARHWPVLHPLKNRTRIAACDWLLKRLDSLLDDRVPVLEQIELFRRLLELLQALDEILSSRLGADAPLFLPLCRRLAGMLQRATDNRPKPGLVGAATAQVRQVASQWRASAAIDSDKSASASLRSLQDTALPLCKWWLRNQACDLRALHLSRALLWLAVDTLPERNAEGITALRGVPADRLKDYQMRFAAGQYADLLLDVEASLVRAPFWLDGQRLGWECLQQLNAEPAMQCIEFHLALLLQRLPALPRLCFHDGTPFADAATQVWLQERVQVHLHKPSTEPPAVAPAGERPTWELALEDAVQTLPQQGLKAAGQPLKLGLAQALGGRERFFWQLSLARLCFAARQYELARVQLDGLDALLVGQGDPGWEPALACQVLHLLHACCERLPQSHAVRERKEEIFRRLCRLDPDVVLEQAPVP
ncbi:type VI secretion system protein TssA [uncultured Pseudomonas sp.]|uniref:type VI secretion system protein TssA n=1 Tax=uncultured Pseudomonas sp. TaxID=114707 RepID=UPI0025CD8E7E|nr:type VI secretion system protein TssA [uncultured Pseudomonas sp.]